MLTTNCILSYSELLAVWEAATEAERERCAQVCESFGGKGQRGCVAILWTVDDMPGATRDIREKRFTEIASELEARCTEAGSELLSLMFSGD